MDFTNDKLRSLVRKWQTLIEAHVDVKTTDKYTLRMFFIAFTKRRPNQVKRICYAHSSQFRQFEMAEGYLRPTIEGTIVDASCGSGLFLRLFAKSEMYSLVALDFLENMLGQCAEFLKQEDISKENMMRQCNEFLKQEDISKENLILVIADISKLPFVYGSIDVVHAGAALHCWPSPSAALAGHASGSLIEPLFDIFLQPSFDIVHLLQPEFCPSSKPSNIHLPGNSQKPADDKCIMTWKAANKFYFKNLGMVQQLREVRLNFKKDLRLKWEQVNRAVSFIDHLTIIQQEQRSVAYGNGCSLSSNQHVVFKCMWQQKNLFDNLLSMSKDAQLLLLSVKPSHKNNYDIVRAEADMVSVLIDKFIPIFLASKVSLDMYLLGNGGVVMVSAKCMPFIISQQMEKLVTLNFQLLRNFEDIKTLHMHKDLRRFVTVSSNVTTGSGSVCGCKLW